MSTKVSSLRPKYVHHDATSVYVRGLGDAAIHDFLCHGWDGSVCLDGCTKAAHPFKIAQYDKAFALAHRPF